MNRSTHQRTHLLEKSSHSSLIALKKIRCICGLVCITCLWFVSGSQAKEKSDESADVGFHPTNSAVLTKKQSDDLKNATIGDILLMAEENIPFPQESETLELLLSQLKATDVKVLDQSDSHVLIQVYKSIKNGEENVRIPAFKLRYEYKNKIYVNGPLMIDQ
jgi:hypothetical protein